MKKEEKKLGFKKILFLVVILLIIIAAAFYYKKDFCQPKDYTITTGGADKVLNNWFDSFTGEFHCLDSDENANLVSGKTNKIICGIKPQETGDYIIEVTKGNPKINKPADIERWFSSKKWAGNALENNITMTSIEIEVPEGNEGEALSIEVVFRKGNQLISIENLRFEVIEKDISKEGIC